MATNIEVKCNFASVFAQFNSIEEIKSLANNICAQVKEAYENRAKEIVSSRSEVPVEVIVTPVETPTPKSTKNAKNKAKEAKAIAEKFKKEEPAKTESKPKASEDAEQSIALSDTKAIKKLGLTFEKYNERCWVLRGDTKPLRKILKEQFHGVYNSRLNGGEGWVFKTATAQECAKSLGIKVKVA